MPVWAWILIGTIAFVGLIVMIPIVTGSLKAKKQLKQWEHGLDLFFKGEVVTDLSFIDQVQAARAKAILEGIPLATETPARLGHDIPARKRPNMLKVACWINVVVYIIAFVLICYRGTFARPWPTQFSDYHSGLTHGLTSLPTLLMSVFNDDLAVYQQWNDGSSYNTGFAIGLGLMLCVLCVVVGMIMSRRSRPRRNK